MQRRDIERFEAEKARQEILDYVDKLPNNEVIKFNRIMKDYDKINYVLDFLKNLK